MKKRAFRTELLAELRELVAVGRRLAAVAEQGKARWSDLPPEKPAMEPVGAIHTRGPNEGLPIVDDDWDEPQWIECLDQHIRIKSAGGPRLVHPQSRWVQREPWAHITDTVLNVYDEVKLFPGDIGDVAGLHNVNNGFQSIKLRVKRMPRVGKWVPVHNQE